MLHYIEKISIIIKSHEYDSSDSYINDLDLIMKIYYDITNKMETDGFISQAVNLFVYETHR